MISRWVTGAALAAAAITLVACGGGSDSTTGPGGITVLPSGAVSLTAGQSAPLTSTAALKIDAGSTGSENVLVLVDTSLVSDSIKLSYQIAATGIGAAGAVSAPATSLSPAPSLFRAPEATTASTTGSGPAVDMSFGMRLNERNRARFRAGLHAARAAFASPRVAASGASRSLASAAPQVGDAVTINVGSDACSNIEDRGTRVVAVSTHAIVLADTLNPTGGFTPADYQRFATRFDTLVYPLDVDNFGAPSDIDGNNKVILLFTGAVNELTPANSPSYVGGFFYGRDLFPVTDTPEFGKGCPGSNTSEMFYLLAPDPKGSINGNVRRTGFVDSVTTSVIAHEFQHLINASRRMYVTNANDFEVGWLDEGLAHMAEELLFYRESALAPRSNISLASLRNSTKAVNAFNNDMLSNAGRYRSYLEAPSKNSPIRNDDSLETRGATWSLLRYLADRKASSASASDAPTWQALAGSTLSGVPNLRGVFGNDLEARVRDWNIAHYTDDFVTGVVSEYTHPSWNFRTIYPAISSAGSPYPLKVDPLPAAGVSGTLIGGAAAYYRFSIPAGSTANVTLTTAGAVSARVIRVR